MISKAQQLPAPIAALLDAAAERYGVSPALARAIAWIESRGDVDAVSQAGAQGVMQLMPATAKDLGVADPFNAEENIGAGVRYIAALLRKYSGHEVTALAAYNWGPGKVDKAIANGLNFPNQVNEYTRRVLARKSEEGNRGAGSPFFGSHSLDLRCPHCSHDMHVTLEIEAKR